MFFYLDDVCSLESVRCQNPVRTQKDTTLVPAVCWKYPANHRACRITHPGLWYIPYSVYSDIVIRIVFYHNHVCYHSFIPNVALSERCHVRLPFQEDPKSLPAVTTMDIVRTRAVPMYCTTL